jgi:polyisoprenoid-binding protein YceI
LIVFRHAATAAAALVLIAAAPVPAPSRWTVDKKASQLGFASSFAGQAFQGRFQRWEARIQFDPAALDRSSVVAVVDLASASTGDTARDQSLPQADWFDTGRFPRATFTAKRFRALGANRYEAMGALTIRGVTRPATLPFQLAIKGNVAQMRGSLTLNRTAFGIGQGQFAGAETVPLAVRVSVSILARR